MSKIELNRHEMKCPIYGLFLYHMNAANTSKMYHRMGDECPGEITFHRWFEEFNYKTSLDEGDLFNQRQRIISNVSKIWLI